MLGAMHDRAQPHLQLACGQLYGMEVPGGRTAVDLHSTDRRGQQPHMHAACCH